mgnify:CR=1 FL=1|tara:strand:- start:499 stop:1542 length:1044 start_codon:yes stop_codon:yes gene_type:complete
MIKYIFLLLPFLSLGQLDFLKYSTLYTSMSMNTSFIERQDYRAIDKGYEDITQINPYDYNLTIGLRKIARFDYEYKVKTWYYGTEKAVADNVTIGNSVGFEYLFNYSFIRSRNDKFTEKNFWLRYLGKSCVTKIQYVDKQRVDLRYNSFDTRFRINKGNWDFTIGGVFRVHSAYGITPIEDFWMAGESTFQQLAQDFGYAPEQWIEGFYVDQNWYNISGGDSVLVATSNDEFFNHYFGDAVATYNERELEKLGMQKELSAVFGVAYYKYTHKFWLHAWFNLMPLHYGLDEYSYDYGDNALEWLEWDSGAILGVRLNKHLGLFVEGTHLKYWGKEVFDCKFGFNYLIF